MKIAKILTLVLLCVFLLASCGKEENSSVSSAEVETTVIEKIQSNDFYSKTNQTVDWGKYQFELPLSWQYEFTKDSIGVYIYPDKEKPPVFCFTPLETTGKYDLTNKEIQVSLVSSIMDNFKKQLGECEFINYNVPEKYVELSDGSKLNVTGRYSLYITCSSTINGKPCIGYVIAFYLNDTLYSFNLFEYNDSTIGFFEDLERIIKTIKLKETSIETTDAINDETTKETTEDSIFETTEKMENYVYITNSGSKYHTATCRWVSKSCIKILYDDAKSKGYTPCGTCNPGF